jgi:phosphate starvation-inducible membrane PsiE
MSESASHDASQGEASFSPAILKLLETLDNLAHAVVAALFIVMAATVLIHTCIIMTRQMSQITTVPALQTAAPAGNTDMQAAADHVAPDKAKPPEAKEHEGNPNLEDPFFRESLSLLSSILFAVIILELLRTIITYLQTHDIQAIMQEFLVVGIISSVRKILLVGAEASLTGSSGIAFIQEAIGVLLNIGGILLLILGLYMLRRGAAK